MDGRWWRKSAKWLFQVRPMYGRQARLFIDSKVFIPSPSLGSDRYKWSETGAREGLGMRLEFPSIIV